MLRKKEQNKNCRPKTIPILFKKYNIYYVLCHSDYFSGWYNNSYIHFYVFLNFQLSTNSIIFIIRIHCFNKNNVFLFLFLLVYIKKLTPKIHLAVYQQLEKPKNVLHVLFYLQVQTLAKNK